MEKAQGGYLSAQESHRVPSLVLLCLFYISMIYLVLCLRQAYWHLFADDAKCLRTIRSASDCASLQSDIDNLVEWSNTWKLAFNTDKCSICTVSRKRAPIIHDYVMGAKTLTRVDNQRDLGVLITCDARFSEHIFAQVNKANKMLGFIRRTISRSDQLLPTLRSLYVALVRSHLDYASEIWSPKSVTLIKLIEGVQRRATRILLPELSYMCLDVESIQGMNYYIF